PQAMRKISKGNRNCCVQAGYFREIFGVAKIELLPIEVTDLWMRFHNDAGFCAIDSRKESAIDRCDQSVLKFMGSFAKIPDIAVFILRKKIYRILRQLAVQVNRVTDDRAGHSVNHALGVSHGDFIVLESIRSLSLIDKGCAGDQGIKGVVDFRNEIRL